MVDRAGRASSRSSANVAFFSAKSSNLPKKDRGLDDVRQITLGQYVPIEASLQRALVRGSPHCLFGFGGARLIAPIVRTVGLEHPQSPNLFEVAVDGEL